MPRDSSPSETAPAGPAWGAKASANGRVDGQGPDGIHVARDMLGGSIVAAQQLAGWVEEMHRLALHSAASWTQCLTLARQECEQARDLTQLMSVPSRSVNRQLEELASQLAHATQRLHDDQLRWFDQVRTEATDTLQRLLSQTPAAK